MHSVSMHRKWLLSGLLAAGFAIASEGPAVLPEKNLAATADYRLGPGDVLEITIFEVEELSKPAVIAPDGAAVLPLIGAVKLSGLTPREAAARLVALYGNGLLRNPQISVTVKEYHSQPVSVLGAVGKPGIYQLRGFRKLSEVLALAGGLAADSGSVITISRPAETISVATRDLLRSPGGREDGPWVQGGDMIRVSKADVVYVAGEVARPGGFPLKDQQQITVLKAISLAEGLRRDAAPQKAKILHSGGGTRQETPVKLLDILNGRGPDVALAPDDILFVPNSRAKSAMARAPEAAIQVTTGVIIWRR